MVAEATGSIFKRTDGKYFIYLPKNLVEDSAFPLKVESSMPVRIILDLKRQRLLILPVKGKQRQRRKK
mgnify:CR=1 FL=1